MAWGPRVETGAIVPGYSGGFAACVVVSDPDLIFYRDRAARRPFIVGENRAFPSSYAPSPFQKASQRITHFSVETEIHENFM